jgi:hypothetical protein
LDLAKIEDEICEINSRKRRREIEDDRLAVEQKSYTERLALEQKQRESAAYRGEIEGLVAASLPVDDRLKIHCRDYCVSSFVSSSSSSSTTEQICLTKFLRDKGVANRDLKGKEISLGRKISVLARAKFGQDFQPPKKTIFCNGQSMSVNSWTTEHLDLIEEAWGRL